MANETMRIFFPLKIFSYPQYDCSEDEREDISSRDAVAYENQILAAIAKENRYFENDRGLAEYIHDEALKEKVHSLYPTVEVVDGELWGVMTAGLKETLTGEETAALMDYVCGQNSDGYVPKDSSSSYQNAGWRNLCQLLGQRKLLHEAGTGDEKQLA